MVEKATGWLKTNVANLVTWAIVVLGAAMVYAGSLKDVSANTEAVKELRARDVTATAERGVIKTDVRVVGDAHMRMDKRVTKVEDVMSRQEKAVSRLEVLVDRLEKK